MMDTALWSAFVALMAGALYFAWPRSPAWHPPLFHHMVLTTLIRGEVEAANGTLDELKVRLARLLLAGPKPPSGGWTEDPTLLGKDYDPVVLLGVGATWDAIADRDPAVGAAVHRRLSDVRLVWVGEPAFVVPGITAHTVATASAETILRHAEAPSTRLVVATRDHGAALLVALREAPALRDRLRAVWFVGARFDPLWNAAKLTQDAFDTEVDRVTPWFVLRLEDGEGTALTEPPTPASGRRSFAVHDLGKADPALLAEPSLGEAVAIVLAGSGRS